VCPRRSGIDVEKLEWNQDNENSVPSSRDKTAAPASYTSRTYTVRKQSYSSRLQQSTTERRRRVNSTSVTSGSCARLSDTVDPYRYSCRVSLYPNFRSGDP
jgi:hypothetical protein